MPAHSGKVWNSGSARRAPASTSTLPTWEIFSLGSADNGSFEPSKPLISSEQTPFQSLFQSLFRLQRPVRVTPKAQAPSIMYSATRPATPCPLRPPPVHRTRAPRPVRDRNAGRCISSGKRVKRRSFPRLIVYIYYHILYRYTVYIYILYFLHMCA